MSPIDDTTTSSAPPTPTTPSTSTPSTTSSIPPTTTSTTPGDCVDSKPSNWCNRRRRRCKRSEYVASKCPETCGYCVDGDLLCEDHVSSRKCRRAQRKGKCDQVINQYRCAATCNSNCKV